MGIVLHGETKLIIQYKSHQSEYQRIKLPRDVSTANQKHILYFFGVKGKVQLVQISMTAQNFYSVQSNCIARYYTILGVLVFYCTPTSLSITI